MKSFFSTLVLGALLALHPLVSTAAVERTEDIVYGRKFGTALTLDHFKPERPNGAAIIFVVSGGFFSNHNDINPGFYAPFLDRGYTVFAVVHGSQPRFIIPEITQDLHRAVRFIRHNAKRFGIDGHRIGITGASAGGHLSLTLGTQGQPGPADAKDPVDRESSAVQAVACFYPPTDFLNWSKEGDDAVGYGTTRQFQPAFGPQSNTAEGRKSLGKTISPIEFVNARQAPILIIHGDADRLVPLEQANRFVSRSQEVKATVKLVVRAGKDHGWPGMKEQDLPVMADWFDTYLGTKTP